mgnify:CR=1 FL=1|jgi:hypothetical protein
MPKSGLNVALKGLDDLFSSEETRQEEQREQVQQIPVDELFPFKNHPFKVLDDDAMTRTVESISQFGVLAPLIARPRPEGGYEIISGHRRKHAAELAHLDTVPVIVRNMEDDAATILMVDSNLQREHILPSERAFAYKMKLDRKRLKNPNGLILGTPGSGKSFSAKREIANAFLVTDDDIIINDPEGEYSPLVNRLKGQVIKISPNSTQFVNPMDINANYSEEDNPLSLKADFILSLCELVVGGKEGLLPVEKTVIDRCVHLIYRKYFADPCPENMPILEDLYNALLQQDEKEAHHVATALEIYVKGSLNLFNHRTNVNVNNRIVCYDIKELGKQMKKLGMLIVQDQVWGRVTANRSSGKSTRYYMDEMHLLLKEEQTAAYSVEIWKRFRKWGGIPTGLTQNVKDLLSSREVENIFENSDMIIMLNQAAGDRQILAKQLNISPHQLSYVTHSGEGEGLLFFGNVILPFVDRFPTDLELYRIMTTKLGEVSEGQK